MLPRTFTILICTRNRAETLNYCLEKHKQIEDPIGTVRDYIFVDNGSTDNTQEIILDFQKNTRWKVQYILESRLGHSIALNRGCKRAEGDFIAFTDDDAIPEVDWLTQINRVIDEFDADWVFGPVEPIWSGSGAPRWYGEETSGLLACFSHGKDEYISYDMRKSFAGVNHCCKKSSLFSLALYDELLGLRGAATIGGNDDDLYRRALASGCRLVYSPLVRVRHIISRDRLCERVHLKNAWNLGRNEASYINLSKRFPFSLFGIPYFLIRRCLFHQWFWIEGFIFQNHSRAFHHKLRFIRALSTIWTLIKFRFGYRPD